MTIPLKPRRASDLAGAYGGALRGGDRETLGRFASLEHAGPGDIAPFVRPKLARGALEALDRGAVLLVDPACDAQVATRDAVWVHPYAMWAMAKVLAELAEPDTREPSRGVDVVLGPNVTLGPRVALGDRVRVGASSVIGSEGFGWAVGPRGERVHVPQLGGVVLEEDVWVGPLGTVDAGTLGPTRVRKGAKLDAHVHVGHNCDVGEATVVAAQCGFAGSVSIGRRVLIGGQVGIADHVQVGDDARIAAKSGVIGDVPAGGVVAGYPAVPRVRWLRGLASLYRRQNQSRG